jgi:hypothetical protein
LAEKLALLPVIDALRELGRLDEGRMLPAVLEQLPGYVRVEVGRLLPELADRAAQGRGVGCGWGAGAVVRRGW